MLTYLLFVGLSATVLLLLAAAAEAVIARARFARAAEPYIGVETLVSLSLVRAGTSRIKTAPESTFEEKRAA